MNRNFINIPIITLGIEKIKCSSLKKKKSINRVLFSSFNWIDNEFNFKIWNNLNFNHENSRKPLCCLLKMVFGIIETVKFSEVNFYCVSVTNLFLEMVVLVPK